MRLALRFEIGSYAKVRILYLVHALRPQHSDPALPRRIPAVSPFPGETPSSDCSSPTSNSNASPMPTSRGDVHSPTIVNPQRHIPNATTLDKTKATLHGTASIPKSQPQESPLKGSSRGASLNKNKKGASVMGGLKQSEKTKAGVGGGIVEGTVSEADDMVVCVLHPAGEEGDGDANG